MSEIKTDKLTGKTTAGDITVTVGATATAKLEQGLTKVWGSYNLKDNTAYDAFNVSSNQDLATGRSQFNFTNSLNAIDIASTQPHVGKQTLLHTVNHSFVQQQCWQRVLCKPQLKTTPPLELLKMRDM